MSYTLSIQWQTNRARHISAFQPTLTAIQQNNFIRITTPYKKGGRGCILIRLIIVVQPDRWEPALIDLLHGDLTCHRLVGCLHLDNIYTRGQLRSLIAAYC